MTDVDDAVTLAVLLARELEAGVGAALAVGEGVLLLDHVVARIGRPDEGAGSWEGEIVLRPGSRTGRAAVPADPVARSIPPTVASLPVLRVDGVGARWARVLRAAGLHDVGTLAGAGADALHELVAATGSRVPLTLAARARGCAVALDEVPESLAGLSMRTVLLQPPARTHLRTGAALVTCVAVWDAVSTLTAQLDDEVLDLPTASLRRSAR